MAQRERRSGGTGTVQRGQGRARGDNDGILPVLARAVREVENRVRRGKTLWSNVIEGTAGLPRNIATRAALAPICEVGMSSGSVTSTTG